MSSIAEPAITYSVSEKTRTYVGALFGYLFDGYDLLIMAFVLLPMAQFFHAPIGAVAYGFTLALFGSVIGGVFFGWLADKIGRRPTLFITIFTYAVTTLLTAFATSLSHVYVLRFLSGLGVGGEWGIGFSLLNEAWSDRTRGLAGGFLQSMFPAGGLLGILTASYALSTYGGVLGWRYAFAIAGVASLLILSLRFIMPESKMWKSYIERKRAGKLPPGYDIRSTLVQIFSKSVLRSTVFGTIMVIFYMFFFYAGNTFYPTYFSLVAGSAVRNILLIGTISGIIGEWVIGYSGDMIGRRKTAFIFGPLGILLILPFYFYVTAQFKFIAISTYPLFFAFVALNFPQSGFPALFGTWFSETFPTRMRSTASNFCYLIGRGLGGGLAPIVVPLWTGSFGKGPVALGSALSVAMIIGAVGMMVGATGLRETRGTKLTPV